MICPNCGKECTEDEYFCRKCGTKVGSFKFAVDDDKKAQNDYSQTSGFNNIVGGIPEKEVPEDDLGKTIDTSHILDNEEVTASFKDPSKEKPIELGSVDDDFGMIDPDDRDSGKRYESSSVDNVKPEKKKKTKLIILLIIVGIITTVLATTGIIYLSDTAKFNKYYKAGEAYMENDKYDDARTQFKLAADKAFTSSQKIKSYEKVYEADEMIGLYDEEEIAYMEALIDLDDENVQYYKNLIILYQNNNKDEKIARLKSSAPKKVQAELKGFDGTIPSVNYPPAKYAKPLDIKLAATDDVTIYYTLDGSKVEDSQTRKEYKKPIMLSDEGQYNLRAASKSKKSGKFSKEFKGKYELDFGSVKEPSVNLDSDKYTEQKKIRVSCDPDCTIYYTKDGTVPTDKSKKYSKAIKMPKGTSLYYFVAINSDGVSSGVVTRAYDYSPDFSFSYDEALNALSSNLVSNNVFEEKNGTFKNKDIGYLNYKSVEEMDGAFYYIIQVEICDKNDKTKSTSYYGVSTDSGHVEKVKRSGGKYSIE